MFHNSKADVVFLAFSNCILIRTPPYSSGGDMGTTQRAKCLLHGVMTSHCVTAASRCCPCCKDQSMQLLRVFIGIGASLDATVALTWVCNPALLFKTLCMTESGSFVFKAQPGCSSDVGCSVPFPIVFSSCLCLPDWFCHPSTDFFEKCTNCHLTLRVYRELYTG